MSLCLVWLYWGALRSGHSAMYTWSHDVTLFLSEYKWQHSCVKWQKVESLSFSYFPIFFLISKYHEYVPTKPPISVFPRAHWHVSFFNKSNKGSLSLFSHISWLFSLFLFPQNPYESLHYELGSTPLLLAFTKDLFFFSSWFILYFLWIIKHHSVFGK